MDVSQFNFLRQFLLTGQTGTSQLDVVGEKRKRFKTILDTALVHVIIADYLSATKCYEDAYNVLKNDPYPDEYLFDDDCINILKHVIHLCILNRFKNTSSLQIKFRVIQEMCTKVYSETRVHNPALNSLMKGVFILVCTDNNSSGEKLNWSTIKPTLKFDSNFATVHSHDILWCNDTGDGSPSWRFGTGEYVSLTNCKSIDVEPIQKSTKYSQTDNSNSLTQQTQTLLKCQNAQTQTKESHTRDFHMIGQHLEKQNELLLAMKTMQSTFMKEKEQFEEKVKDYEAKLQQKEMTINMQAKTLLNEGNILRTIQAMLTDISKKQQWELENFQNKNFALHNALFQLWDKYYTFQQEIIRNADWHTQYVIKDLKEVLPKSTSITTPTTEAIEEEIKIWDKDLEAIKQSKQNLENCHHMFHSKMKMSAFTELISCMEPTYTPFYHHDLIHGTFATNFQSLDTTLNNVNWHKTKGLDSNLPDLASQRSSPISFSINPVSKVLKTVPLSPKARDAFSNASSSPPTSTIPGEAVPSSYFEPPTEEWISNEIGKLSIAVKNKGGPNFWRLMVYLKMRLADQSEEKLAAAVDAVRQVHGKLSGISRDTILAEVRRILEVAKKQGQKPAWVNLQNNWSGNAAESDCSICFDKFDADSSKMLACHHKFHRECIDMWLQSNTVCPICRKFAVSDIQFPPLRN